MGPERIDVVELFAGVGGFRIGLERSSERFNTVWADQWEPGKKNQFAFNCYEAHFGSSGSVNVNRNISEVKGDVPPHRLLVGGFPCQDYSVARTGATGIKGKKGVLWWDIHDIIRSRSPEYVLLENVDRLIKSPASQRGRDFGVMLRCLADLGYCAEWRTINAAEYGYVQRRRRVFIFATRNKKFSEKITADFPEYSFFSDGFPASYSDDGKKYDISESKFKTLADLSDGFAADFKNSGYMCNHSVVTRSCTPTYDGEYAVLNDILQKDVDEKYYVDNIEKWKYLKNSKKIMRTSKKGITYEYSEGKIAFPDFLDRPGRTMLTSESTLNRSSHLILDPQTERYRILTPVECERMNYFPDGWTDTGMTERQRYFAMGNALVTPLIEKMGDRIIELIDGE
jgi:DNA (cytosine-5)-methyltransferase 1